MRILPIMPRSSGYEPQAIDLNQEEATLDITHPALCVLEEESKLFAESLVLRCSLKPLPLQNQALKVQLILEGDPLESALLYDTSSLIPTGHFQGLECQWEGLSLQYEGSGYGTFQGKTFPLSGNSFPFGQIQMRNPLYLKPFHVEQEAYQERRTTLPTGQVLTSPPGVTDTVILRRYGGYYKKGIPLSEIQQIYYSLTSSHGKTRVRLYKATDPHTPQRLYPQEEESPSFGGAIASGSAPISVVSNGLSLGFSSYLCEPVPGQPNLINVHFRPKGDLP